MSARPATLILDNEAVQALADVRHRKHRRALAFIEAANQRNARDRVSVIVPVTVRVEAAWDRTDPAAAMLNRLSRARDVVLESLGADRAADLRTQTGVSVVDATIAQAAEAAGGPVAVLTSDGSDMRRLAAVVTADLRVLQL